MTSQQVGPVAPGTGPPGPSAAGGRRRRPFPLAVLAGARPKQWVKNLLVFAAPGAAAVLDQREAFLQTVGAFVCFCLASAGTYFLNDAADVEADRVLAAVLIVAGVGGSAFIDWHLTVVVASYVALTTAYSTWLKHVAVADVVAVAAGFVLRAIAGATATGVPISNWFFIVASFGSLFMVVAKRRAEVETMGEAAASTRRTLGTYSLEYLSHLQTASMAVVLVGYCLWAFEKAAVADSGFPWFQLSIVPFALAVLRYSLLVDTGHGGAPEEVVMGDRSLQGFGAAWFAVFAAGVYWP
jgi:decaprenyl-phosphate phosphoribosyltransferase